MHHKNAFIRASKRYNLEIPNNDYLDSSSSDDSDSEFDNRSNNGSDDDESNNWFTESWDCILMIIKA